MLRPCHIQDTVMVLRLKEDFKWYTRSNKLEVVYTVFVIQEILEPGAGLCGNFRLVEGIHTNS